ncbi:cox cluster protein [Halogeometricum sp. S1BR25-6]|uniref:Cox cluster protein n=1 Tax=Halogeometricum salsisoli TaxID=2950536 RepID=A0ABU2GBQ5_9EURY|nr:cox cluster protein [Halogeometricum sp. S1BR25-6]MDS0298222.1 cox cluster protein [Halogeometricum sp. S1BR25-6]
MDDTPGLSDQYRMASPWPIFVALGIPVSEIGILFDLFPVAVGGLLLFSGSVAGMTRESGYSETPWGPLAVLGGIFLALGVAFVFTAVNLQTRGYAVIAAAVILLLAAAAGHLFGPREEPSF